MPSDKTRSLFGTVHRERVLAALARGPLHVRALAREVGLGERGAWDVVERFRRMGVVAKRDRPGSYVLAALDPRFPAADELRDLIATLHPEAALPADRPAWRRGLNAAPRGKASFAGLFGSAMRTRLLMLLAVVGEATPAQARSALRQSRGTTMLDAVRRLHALGVVKWWHRGNDARIALDPRWPAHVPLARLLRRLAAESPGLMRAIKVGRAPGYRDATPEERLPFLRPAHARALLSLRDGPLRIAEFATRHGVTRATARDTVLALEACGLVLTEKTRNGIVVSLNAARPDFASWWTLLHVADREHHPARPPRASPRAAADADWSRVPVHARTARVMLAIATNGAPADRPNEVARIVNRLTRAGLLRRDDGRVTFTESYAAAVADVLGRVET